MNLIKKIKKDVPPYVRIQRISRDIPSQKILAGAAKISNLRQILSSVMEKEKWRCGCIRCREVRENYDPKEKIRLFRQDYPSSDGKEIFLSFKNRNKTKLYSLLRLRITSENKAIIREIHTYGQLVPVSETRIAPQHKGFGRKLLKEAEKIVKKEFKLGEIAVISGIGARDYFRRLGYELKDTYMVKKI
jgi:elongator complex protein 3